VRVVASQDLPPAESVLQTLDNLQQLNAAVNNIFARLTSRIAAERDKLNHICDRTARASQKIKHIGSNQNRVCTIFSASKFPGAASLADFKKIVSENDVDLPAPLNRGRYRMTQQMRAQRPVATDTSELFQDLTHASATRADRSTFTDGDEGSEGLGRLPTYLPSVDSAILFNSEENPYKKYASFNNLEGVGGQDRAKASTDIFSAPQTLQTGAELPAFVGLHFDYRPDAGAVPTLALPTNLPLAKLADISFGGSAGASIAPSTASLFELPTFAFDLNAPPTAAARPRQPVSAVPSNYHALSAVGAPPPLAAVAAAPPAASAVAPPSAAAAAFAQPPSAAAVVPAASSVPAPPPNLFAAAVPAPPSGLLALPAAAAAAPAATKPTAALVPADSSGGNRGGVLASIREGIKLRSTTKDAPPAGAGAAGGKAGPGGRAAPTAAAPKDMRSMLMEGLHKRAALIAERNKEEAAAARPAPAQAPRPAAPGPDSGLDADLKRRLAAVAASKAAEGDGDDGDDDGEDWK
jgi:hypothetical protein